MDQQPELLQSVSRLKRDLREAAVTLTPDEARFLVDAYYTLQTDRIRSDAQARQLAKSGEPHVVMSWLGQQSEVLESQVKVALDRFSGASQLGRWARSICGIGPVIAAGLLAHIDIRQAPTVGHIWRFAGLDPTQRWEKKTKRPWNADLKRLCFIIGESFVKVSNREDDIYGKVWRARKDQEIATNDAGGFAAQAATILTERKFGDDTDAKKWYSQGKLPPAHIHARARRYAVKLFLSHYHHVGYVLEHDKLPPKPYVIEHGGHVHFLAPPHWPLTE